MNYQNLFNRDHYPTPKSVIDIMMAGEDVNGKIVLEPHAGTGNIVNWLNKNGASAVLACEINDTMRRALKGCDIVGKDFFTLPADIVSGVEYIVMNPPYLNGWKHLEHAYDIAPQGATILCLLPWRDGYDFYSIDEWGERAGTGQYSRIREIVALYGSAQNIGSVFNQDDSERKHTYDIALVKIYKPKDSKSEFDDCLWDLNEFDGTGGAQGLMPYNEVYNLVSRYIQAMKMFDEVHKISNALNEAVSPLSSELKFNCKLVNEKVDGEISRARYKKELLKACWSKVVNVFNLQKYATSKLREQINSFVEQQSSVPFTMTNIYRMADMIIQTNDQRMESIICDAFDMICSFAPENCDLDKRGRANNVDAWKTNSDYMVNKRFIVPNVISYNGWYLSTGYNADRMADVVKALNFLCLANGASPIQHDDYISRYEKECRKMQGLPITKSDVTCGYSLINMLEETCKEYGKWYEFDWFKIKIFKKGTMHFEFIGEQGEKIWARFNQIVANKRGWRIGQTTTNKKNKQ